MELDYSIYNLYVQKRRGKYIVNAAILVVVFFVFCFDLPIILSLNEMKEDHHSSIRIAILSFLDF